MPLTFKPRYDIYQSRYDRKWKPYCFLMRTPFCPLSSKNFFSWTEMNSLLAKKFFIIKIPENLLWKEPAKLLKKLQKQTKTSNWPKKSTQKVNRIFGLATVAFGPELWPMELQGVLNETHSSPLPRQNFPTLLRKIMRFLR